ncbi:MAG: 3-oxoacyl-ACP synthase [Desulfobulbaceae bacterium BRH_c16a]|nr:MAG: 3-oxoacyl-ACP synthase [Desulfobulbaceae bacterium BRH_c16a]
MDIFINDLASFLPNAPVDNDHIEEVLGRINNLPSRTKRRILNNNKINTRHYALDPATGRATHTNAQLTAEAVRRLRPTAGFTPADIECLCCGSASPDLAMPGHGVMVAGELRLPPCDVVTTAGICVAGVTALKYACMNVACGSVDNAVATGSEIASSYMKAGFFSAESAPAADLKKKPILGFDADFLRWMLSDGAGAAYVSGKKNDAGLCYRVEWIENRSYAGELETCMYAGGRKQADGQVQGWRQMNGSLAAAEENVFAVRQDVKLLDEHIVKTAMARALPAIAGKRKLRPESIDWYLPHYSSDYFRDRFYQGMKGAGFEIPYEKWFTNLAEVGNIGSASIYLLMEGLLKSGNLKDGDRVLCFIPESGRFSHCFMLLTVVGVR